MTTTTDRKRPTDGVEPGDRYEQISIGHPRIDRDAGVLHRVHIMGRKSKHGYEYGLPSQRDNAAKWPGMVVGLDHNFDSSPMRLEQAWGEVVEPVEVDHEGTWGDVRYLKTHPRTEQILEAAEKGMAIGLSAVTRVAREINKVVEQFMPVRLDLVVGAATVPSLFEQGATMATDTEPTEMSAEDHTAAALHSALDAVLKEDSEGHEKAKRMAKMIKAMHEDKKEDADETKVEKTEETAEKKGEKAEKEEMKAEREEQSRALKSLSDRFEQMATEYPILKASVEQFKKQAAEFENRLKVAQQFASPQSAQTQRLEQATDDKGKPIDLKSFWDPSIPA